MDTETKRKHRAQGLCTDCHEPALWGRTKCARHLKGNRKAVQKYIPGYRKRLKDEGRCVQCSRLLVEGFDDGYKTCINCRTGFNLSRW